jgi:hypothetical protein
MQSERRRTRRHLLPYASQIDAALAAAAASGSATLELPISPCLGHDVGLLGLTTPTIRLGSWPPPLLAAELIARSEAVITRSLHLSIVALACGVPVYQRSAPDPKYRALDGFESVQWWADDDDIAQALPGGLGRRDPEPAVTGHLERLGRHWDEIAALVGTRNADGERAIARLLGTVTDLLESSASADAAVLEPDTPLAKSRPKGLRTILDLRR